MKEPRTVAIVGAHGRMGRFAHGLLARSAEFEVVGAFDREDDLERALPECGAALGLDFTVAGHGFGHGRAMLAAGLRPVIGTSGVDARETAELDRLARDRGLGGLVVPNFSLGAWLLERCAREAVRLLPRCEIVEMHHDAKRDAPSGTAVRLREVLEGERGGDGSIAVHSLRLPGLYAHHAVRFGAPGEMLLLQHDTRSPEAFGPGILFALELASEAVGVRRGLPWDERATSLPDAAAGGA